MRGSTQARGLRGGLWSRGASSPLRTPDRTSPGLLVAGENTASRSVALFFDDPAGVIATRTAGVVEFEAALAWRSPDDVPRGPLLPEFKSTTRCSITEIEDPEMATRCLAGEMRALKPSELGSSLEAVLRAVTAVAALTEAMLEVGAVRTVLPVVPSARALEELARDIWGAGFRVRFGPSWTPSPGADVCVGVGDDYELQEFLRSHPSWSIA